MAGNNRIWYDNFVKSDASLGIEDDVRSLGKFIHRVAELRATPSVRSNAGAMRVVEDAEKFALGLTKFYKQNVWKSGVVRIFVDAQDRKTGAYKNFGGTKREGGYVMQASLDDARYVLAAAMLVPEGAGNYRTELAAKAKELKGDVDASGVYTGRDSNAKRAMTESNALVDRVRKEAVVSAALAGTSTERRNRVSEQLSYRQAKALVHYFGNDWMRESVDALASNGGGIFKISNEGVNLGYIVNEVRMTPAEVRGNHPRKYGRVAPAIPAPAPRAGTTP